MNTGAVALFALLAAAALLAGGIAVAARSVARASLALTGLAAALAAVLAGYLGLPYLAGATLLSGAGLAAAINQVGARSGWSEAGGRRTGWARSCAASAGALAIGVALYAGAVRHGSFSSPREMQAGAGPAGALSSHAHALALAAFVALAAMLAVAEARAACSGGSCPRGEGER